MIFFLQSEYVSARDKRREFVSGFTGSAGLLVSIIDSSCDFFFQIVTKQVYDVVFELRFGACYKEGCPAVDGWAVFLTGNAAT
jgi:hypothetical protein